MSHGYDFFGLEVQRLVDNFHDHLGVTLSCCKDMMGDLDEGCAYDKYVAYNIDKKPWNMLEARQGL